MSWRRGCLRGGGVEDGLVEEQLSGEPPSEERSRRRGPAGKLELELVHGEQGTGQVGNGEYTDEAHQRKREKGRLAHREIVGMVGEDGDRCRRRILAASRAEDEHDLEA
jgi:hypothetical protein